MCVMSSDVRTNFQLSSRQILKADVNCHKSTDVNRDLIVYLAENLSFCLSFPRHAAVGFEPFFLQEFLLFKNW